ncbi:Syt8 [Lemmus lemmus]
MSGWNPKGGVGMIQSSRLVQSSLGPDCLERHLAACTLGPGSRWAVFIVVLAAGVLLVSCLLCGIYCCCCHCQRRRKQPKDKEAVGLGSAPSSTTTHLVRRGDLCLPVPNLVLAHCREGNARSRLGSSGQPWQAFLAEERDEQRFNQMCAAWSPALGGRNSEGDCCSHWSMILEARRVGLRQAENLKAEGTADPYACVSVSTQAGRRHETKVHHGTLCPMFEETCHFSVQLMLNQRKWKKKKKTSSKKNTTMPYFNEAFTFLVSFSQLQSVDLVLAVWAHGLQLRAEPVGKVLLGSRASGQCLQHWADMLAHARRPIAQWHHLQSPREVDRALALKPRLPLPRPRS